VKQLPREDSVADGANAANCICEICKKMAVAEAVFVVIPLGLMEAVCCSATTPPLKLLLLRKEGGNKSTGSEQGTPSVVAMDMVGALLTVAVGLVVWTIIETLHPKGAFCGTTKLI
jgi:hypothetical protein